MTHQKKKKITPQLLKQQEAEIKKKFKQKIQGLFSLFGQEQLFKLVPNSYLDILFVLRFRTPHVFCKGKLPHGFKTENELNLDFISFLKTHKVKINQSRKKINFYDYFTCGFDFSYGFLTTENFRYNEAELVKEKLNGIYQEYYATDAINKILNQVFSTAYTHYSTFNYGYYVMHVSIEQKEPSKSCKNAMARLAFSLNEIYRPRPIEIKIGNNVRPAFEVGILEHEVFKPVCLKAADLYLDEENYTAPIPVYIQNHAMQRLAERIALFDPGLSQFFVVVSLLDCLQVRQIEEKSYLLDYHFYDWKIGYLRADLIKGKLIIRTFLLSTQEGTPEEQKFRKMTKLRRDDIEYLKMTSLGDFADSGIENDPRLKAIFEEAGLTSLLECAKQFYNLNEGAKPLSERVNKYITLEPLKPNWHEVAETIADELETENQPCQDMSLVEINN